MDKPKVKVILKTEVGKIYRVKNIPSSMFEFFIHKRGEYKDGTGRYALGVSVRHVLTAQDSITFEIIRGTEAEAEARLIELINLYAHRK